MSYARLYPCDTSTGISGYRADTGVIAHYVPLINVRASKDVKPEPLDQVSHYFHRFNAGPNGSADLLHVKKTWTGCDEYPAFPSDTGYYPSPPTLYTGMTPWLQTTNRWYWWSALNVGSDVHLVRLEGSSCRCFHYFDFIEVKAGVSFSMKCEYVDFFVNGWTYKNTCAMDWISKAPSNPTGKFSTTAFYNHPQYDVYPRHTATLDKFSLPSRETQIFDGLTQIGAFQDHDAARCFAAAYANAIEQVPMSTCNNIQNILDLASAASAVFGGSPKRAKKGLLRDYWMKYRYSYTTSKLDMQDIISTSYRISNLINSSSVKCYGVFNKGPTTYRCTFDFDPSSAIPNSLKSFLNSYGFRLTAANVWDMIPYSFVVDWFLGIGDLLETYDAYSRALMFPVSNPWYSMKTMIRVDGVAQESYLRYRGTPFIKALPYTSNHKTSTKTQVSRVADAAVLFGN